MCKSCTLRAIYDGIKIPNMNITDLIEQVKEMNLPKGEFAIFGSAVMAIRGMREVPNIDLIVTDKLWSELLGRGYTPDYEGFIRKNMVKISNWWFAATRRSIPMMIEDAETIQDLPFVKLDEVRFYKSKLNREKDIADVKLIDRYLESNSDSEGQKGLGIETYKGVIDLFVNRVTIKFWYEILSMVVFGSVSRGQAKGDSDIDIFIYFDDKLIDRYQMEKQVNEIVIEIRESKEYIDLEEKEILPEIYPFYIAKSNSNNLPWVCLDSCLEGKIIFDRDNFGKNVMSSYLKKIELQGGRKVNLPQGGWCWTLSN